MDGFLCTACVRFGREGKSWTGLGGTSWCSSATAFCEKQFNLAMLSMHSLERHHHGMMGRENTKCQSKQNISLPALCNGSMFRR